MKQAGFKQTELYLLHEIVIRLDRLARESILEPEGITYAEFLVLMATRELPSPSQEEVGAFIDMSKSLVSQRVSPLMKKGLLRQEEDAENRRRVRLALSPKGLQVVERIYGTMEESTEPLFAALGKMRPAFRQSLATMAEELSKEEGVARPE